MRARISGQRTLKTIAKSVGAAALALAASAFANPGAGPGFSGPHDAGLMAEPREREASGLAPSRRNEGVYWVHNDSGDDPIVHAIDRDGRRRGRIRLAGVRAEDWEDLASFSADGRSFLLVADTGDNFSSRSRALLHIVPEPALEELAPDRELVVAPAYTISFAFEDGARDCEAVVVDPADRTIWLLTKRDTPARLYRLPLAPPEGNGLGVARYAGNVPGLSGPDELRRRMFARFSPDWPTALDFSPDGRTALVLNLEVVMVFSRGEGESWPEALARRPVALPPHDLPQAEAACFAADGSQIIVCSENTRRWVRYDRTAAAD